MEEDSGSVGVGGGGWRRIVEVWGWAAVGGGGEGERCSGLSTSFADIQFRTVLKNGIKS